MKFGSDEMLSTARAVKAPLLLPFAFLVFFLIKRPFLIKGLLDPFGDLYFSSRLLKKISNPCLPTCFVSAPLWRFLPCYVVASSLLQVLAML